MLYVRYSDNLRLFIISAMTWAVEVIPPQKIKKNVKN